MTSTALPVCSMTDGFAWRVLLKSGLFRTFSLLRDPFLLGFIILPRLLCLGIGYTYSASNSSAIWVMSGRQLGMQMISLHWRCCQLCHRYTNRSQLGRMKGQHSHQRGQCKFCSCPLSVVRCTWWLHSWSSSSCLGCEGSSHIGTWSSRIAWDESLLPMISS